MSESNPTPQVIAAQKGDVVTTELVRNSLGSAAMQMRQVLTHTAFSRIIYEVIDFACGIFDRDVRLLAQAPTLALFVGTLDACVRGAVEGIGGEDKLRPGDVLIYNDPYGIGSHPQDSSMVMPAFVDGELVGYAACKAHWVDIGGKDVYSTDTVDVYQEGTFFPGVRLYSAGERNDEIWRMVLANSRAPELLAGDVSGQVASVRAGVSALGSIVKKHGQESFQASVERIYDDGEAAIRSRLAEIEDGRYEGECLIEGDGRSDEEIAFTVAVEIEGDSIVVDLTDAPDQAAGPINSPLPGTMSAARVALMGLASATEIPDEGQFRPLEVKTRPGSIFNPTSPAPVFTYWVSQVKLIDGITRALAPVVPGLPADSGGEILAVCWWGQRRADFQNRFGADEPWIDGSPTPIGQGASAKGDGGSSLMHMAEACTRVAPIEVTEANNPWLVKHMELRQDSAGAGRYRGGLGIEFGIECLEESFMTVVMEATKRAPRGIEGGAEARPSRSWVEHLDGARTEGAKQTALPIEKGGVFSMESGGGAGYGDPAERSVEAVADDLADGYISREFAARWHPAQLRQIEG